MAMVLRCALHYNTAMQTTFEVAGIDCSEEVEALQRALRPVEGVTSVRVNLMSGTVTVGHAEEVPPERLLEAIRSTGLHGALRGSVSREELEGEKRRDRRFVAVSGAAMVAGLILDYFGGGRPWLGLGANIAYAIAIASGGRLIFPKALRAIRQKALDMNVLMTVAVAGAMVINQWSEAGAVTFLFALSEMLEAMSLARARRAVQALMQLAPPTAILIDADGSRRELPVEAVPIGARIAVRAGARIPLDGVVQAGASSVDQAPITGESMPVEKGPGDSLYAGTINGSGALEVETTRAAGDTTLSQIIRLVEQAQERKAPSQRFVDRFAAVYTPLVILVALCVIFLPPLFLGGAWGTWFYRGLVLLVIACPCALVISTPVSIVSGLTSMARRGVLIKGGAVLEALGKVTALAVDKTGTITEGQPRVVRVIPCHSYSESEILRVAAAIDSHSSHPLSRAVVAYAEAHGIAHPRGEGYTAHSGKGAEAWIDGHLFFVGNHRFTHEAAVCTPEVERLLETIEGEAQSVVIVGHKPEGECRDCQGEVIGIVAIADTIRPEAASAIAALHRVGVRKVVMLSGDNQRTVDTIAARAGIDVATGDLLPEHKIEHIRQLHEAGHRVAMVGDGVNDAPAMAEADVGIAMGRGADTALEAGDMVLMKSDLSRVAEAISLGRRTLRVIQANIAFSLLVKALFLALAVVGKATLWMAIAADTGATLVVIANALRLLEPGKVTLPGLKRTQGSCCGGHPHPHAS